MKKMILPILAILTFCSCDNNNVSHNPTGPTPWVTIIKFTKPEYVNNLIVSDYKNFDNFILMRGNECSANYLMNFHSQNWNHRFPSLEDRTPYIELTDGWYLVDWTWYHYPYDGKTLLTEVTWDIYNGECNFDKSVPHISKNVFQKKEIEFASFVTYLFQNGECPMFDIYVDYYKDTVRANEYLYFSSIFGHLDGFDGNYGDFLEGPEDRCLCNLTEELDDLWETIRQQLINIINNGDLDKLPVADYEILLKESEEYGRDHI